MPTPLSINVKYGATPTNTLNNITELTFNRGRSWPTDPYSPAQADILCRDISSWSPVPEIGDLVIIYQNVTARWAGFIRDVKVNYGNKTSMDTAVISVEAVLSRFARKNPRNRSISQNNSITQLNQFATDIGLSAYIAGVTPGIGQSILSAQTFTGNALDYVNTAILTEVGYINETVVSTTPRVTFVRRNAYDAAQFTFTETNTGVANTIVYNGIEFTSAAEQYYTEAIINPLGLATQTAGSGQYSVEQDSYDYTTTQALSHAQYLLSQYNNTTAFPKTLTINYSTQVTAGQQSAIGALLAFGAGQLADISFRGTTYNTVVEGISVTVTLDDILVTLNLSPADVSNYLTLNDSLLGRLNYNKLGF